MFIDIKDTVNGRVILINIIFLGKICRDRINF